MEQLSVVVWGLVMVISILVVLAGAAAVFGADSRPCVGDSHTDTPRTDWI